MLLCHPIAAGKARVRGRCARRWAAACLATTALTALSDARADGAIRDLSAATPGYTWFYAAGVSGNGAYVVGRGIDADGHSRSFIYDNAAGRMTDLGIIGGDVTATTAAFDVSNTGAVTGFASDGGSSVRAFRWTASAGMQNLGTLMGLNEGSSDGRGISNDGTRIVGSSIVAGAGWRAYVWIEGATNGVAANPQMFALPSLLSATAITWANGISGDGAFAVGGSVVDGTVNSHAVRWSLRDIATTGTASVLDLGTLGGADSTAQAVSNDGRVVVGYSSFDASLNTHAFRWVEGGTGGVAGNPQMRDLGTLGGLSSAAQAVSGDGAVVVGWSQVNETPETRAFRWTSATGMVSVASWLAANGVATSKVLLDDATGVSDDGNIVVGTMRNADDAENDPGRPYIARVAASGGNPGTGNPGTGNPGTGNPGNGNSGGAVSGLMDVREYNRTLYAGQVARIGQNLSWLPMNGSHHRPLMDYPTLPGNACFWISGDLARYGNGRDTDGGLAEAGLCADLFGGQARAGLGVGTSHTRQDLLNDGNSRLDGQYIIGEVDWQPAGSPVLLSLTGLYGSWNADIRRNYTNGASMTTSHGETDVRSAVVRLRADWKNALTFGGTGISPYASFTIGRTDADSYTETFGSFPARFNSQTLVTGEGRLGMAARTALSATTALGGTVELVHAAGDAPRASGQAIGLFGFDFGGGRESQTWVRVGADLDQKIGERALLSFALHAATRGYDATLSGAVRFQASF